MQRRLSWRHSSRLRWNDVHVVLKRSQDADTKKVALADLSQQATCQSMNKGWSCLDLGGGFRVVSRLSHTQAFRLNLKRDMENVDNPTKGIGERRRRRRYAKW